MVIDGNWTLHKNGHGLCIRTEPWYSHEGSKWCSSKNEMETDFYHHDINIIFYNNDLLIGDHITVLLPLQGHTTLIQGLTLNLFFLLPGRSLSITAMTRSEVGLCGERWSCGELRGVGVISDIMWFDIKSIIMILALTQTIEKRWRYRRRKPGSRSNTERLQPGMECDFIL